MNDFLAGGPTIEVTKLCLSPIRVTCQSPFLKAPPTKSPQKNWPPCNRPLIQIAASYIAAKKLRRLVNNRLETTSKVESYCTIGNTFVNIFANIVN